MPSIYLSQTRYDALRSAAEQCGYTIGSGARSQTGEFIQSLIEHESTTEYNSIFSGLASIGLEISSDIHDTGETWHYRWKRNKTVRGFSTPAAALIAAFQDRS